jgi:chorismate mutase
MFLDTLKTSFSNKLHSPMKITFLRLLPLAIILISTAAAKAQSQTTKSDKTLEINRRKIDSIDQQLIQLVGEREKCVKEIGIYKAKNHIVPLQAARFQEVLNNAIQTGAKEGLSAEFITQFMNAVHKESLRIEDALK